MDSYSIYREVQKSFNYGQKYCEDSSGQQRALRPCRIIKLCIVPVAHLKLIWLYLADTLRYVVTLTSDI